MNRLRFVYRSTLMADKIFLHSVKDLYQPVCLLVIGIPADINLLLSVEKFYQPVKLRDKQKADDYKTTVYALTMLA